MNALDEKRRRKTGFFVLADELVRRADAAFVPVHDVRPQPHAPRAELAENRDRFLRIRPDAQCNAIKKFGVQIPGRLNVDGIDCAGAVQGGAGNGQPAVGDGDEGGAFGPAMFGIGCERFVLPHGISRDDLAVIAAGEDARTV